MKIKTYLPAPCFLSKPHRLTWPELVLCLNTGQLGVNNMVELELDLTEYKLVATKPLLDNPDVTLGWFAKVHEVISEEKVKEWKNRAYHDEKAEESIERKIDLTL